MGSDADRCGFPSRHVPFDNADDPFSSSGAVFMAVSYELPDTCGSPVVEPPVLLSYPETHATVFHDIIFNGYVRFLLNIPLPRVTKTELDHG